MTNLVSDLLKRKKTRANKNWDILFEAQVGTQGINPRDRHRLGQLDQQANLPKAGESATIKYVGWDKKNSGGDSGGDEESSLRSALSYLRGVCSTDGEYDGLQWYEKIPREIKALKSWAGDSSFFLDDLAGWQAKIIGGGQEHDVAPPDEFNRVGKLTKRNGFGLFPHFDQGDQSVGLRPASPIEYFERLLLQNDWFADDNRLEGIGINDAGSIYTLTSQPFIQGRAATLDEIAEMLSGLGFTELDRELAAWIEPSEQIILSDAHPRNVVTDAKGYIIPIDLIMGRY